MLNIIGQDKERISSIKILNYWSDNYIDLNLNNTMIQFPGPSTIKYLQHNELIKWSIRE